MRKTVPFSGDQNEFFRFERKAALAEAYHVDSRYDDAAEAWSGLAQAGYSPAESILKAAISWLSLGDSRGPEWLRVAASWAPDDTKFVQAQLDWHRGAIAKAIEAFEGLQSGCGGSSAAATALGVLHWRIGHPEQARAHFLRAVQLNHTEAEAFANLASMELLTGNPPARKLLEIAAVSKPHLYHPHVLESRWLRRIGHLLEAKNALKKARIRQRNFAAVPSATMARIEVDARADVTFIGDRLFLNVVLRLPVSTDCLPTLLFLNGGYCSVSIGSETWVAQPTAVREMHLPKNAWIERGPHRELELQASGNLVPPCAALRPGEFEFAAPSAWLPVLPARFEAKWRVAISRSGYSLFASGDDAIGLAAPPSVTVEKIVGRPATRCIGRIDPSIARFACLYVARTAALWNELAGHRNGNVPPIVVVSEPHSTFCYTRAAFIRVASGVLRDTSGRTLLCHETGHLWWGVDVRTPTADHWLTESLAEYSVHMAEDAGVLKGYRAGIASRLRSNAPLANCGLKELFEKKGPQAARILREKGGYVIRMLRHILGEVRFRSLAKLAYGTGREHGLDAYTFSALASRVYGHSLNWFFNQWVYANAGFSFRITSYKVSQQHNGRYELSVELDCGGVATPGALVPISVECEDGRIIRSEANFELEHCRLTLLADSHPIRINVDPDSEWYAPRTFIELDRERKQHEI
jgi:tetratricopeptide (TPR) repeat protein